VIGLEHEHVLLGVVDHVAGDARPLGLPIEPDADGAGPNPANDVVLDQHVDRRMNLDAGHLVTGHVRRRRVDVLNQVPLDQARDQAV
jgi:hypothetical protein